MLAIVLARQDFKEYDQIISFYTREEGRRDLLARGIKKIVSKNSAHVEPGCVVEIGIAKGKEMDILTSVESEEYFSSLRKEYYKSLLAEWVTQSMKHIFLSPEPDLRVFSLLFSWLSFVNETPVVSAYCLDAFILRILECLGFLPILDQCVNCEKKLSGQKFFFSPAAGGILCHECLKERGTSSEYVQEITAEVAGAFAGLLRASWSEFSSYPRDKRFYEQLHRLVIIFFTYHLETRVPDWLNLAKLSDFLV